MPHGWTEDNFISSIQSNLGSLVRRFTIYTNNFGVKDFKECTSLIQDVRVEIKYKGKNTNAGMNKGSSQYLSLLQSANRWGSGWLTQFQIMMRSMTNSEIWSINRKGRVLQKQKIKWRAIGLWWNFSIILMQLRAIT